MSHLRQYLCRVSMPRPACPPHATSPACCAAFPTPRYNGCKRRRNQRTSAAEPPPTPSSNPVPADTVAEYYWGYGSGIVATKVPDWGEFIRKNDLRKEDRIQEILKERGEQPGLVHIFSALEPCSSYQPWHNKDTGKTYLKKDGGQCLHYYFYFSDPDLGLCYLRVPTWCPFRLQFYCNGHAWLASQLRAQGVEYEMVDNAFVHIADYALANRLVAQFDVEQLHAKLDEIARHYCPVVMTLNLSYHWSIMQAEYATDRVFKQPADLPAFYPHLLETLIHTAKPADIATFLGRKLHGNYQGEMGNRFNVRLLGSRIKHHMGPVSIKMYDKFQVILRIETTVSDVSFFRHYREVHHRNGKSTMQWASLPKTIYTSIPHFSKWVI